MTKFFRFLIMIAPVPFLLVTSCKKKKTGPVSTNIVKVVDSLTTTTSNGTQHEVDTYICDYNSDSTVNNEMIIRIIYNIAMPPVITMRHFTYGLNFIAIGDPSASSDTIFLNENKTIAKTKYSYYAYDTTNKDQLRYIESNPNYTYYFWKDGNLLSNSDADKYEYYTDKTIRAGDGLQLNEFLQFGTTLTKNRNLIKLAYSDQMLYDNYTKSFSYEFDDNDRIIKMRSIMIQPDAGHTTIHSYTFSY